VCGSISKTDTNLAWESASCSSGGRFFLWDTCLRRRRIIMPSLATASFSTPMRRGVGLWSHMRGPISLELSACRNQPKKYNYIYEEHHTHRAHCWRRRPRRCFSANTASNSPSTETSLIATEFSAKKPQNLKQQKLYDSLCPYTRHGMKNESGWTDTVSTARQRQYMQPLPAGQVLILKQNGETFYAGPDTIHHQVHTGYRVQYQAYKQAQLLASRQNPH
jgi:hypothetical protein